MTRRTATGIESRLPLEWCSCSWFRTACLSENFSPIVFRSGKNSVVTDPARRSIYYKHSPPKLDHSYLFKALIPRTGPEIIIFLYRVYWQKNWTEKRKATWSVLALSPTARKVYLFPMGCDPNGALTDSTTWLSSKCLHILSHILSSNWYYFVHSPLIHKPL